MEAGGIKGSESCRTVEAIRVGVETHTIGVKVGRGTEKAYQGPKRGRVNRRHRWNERKRGKSKRETMKPVDRCSAGSGGFEAA